MIMLGGAGPAGHPVVVIVGDVDTHNARVTAAPVDAPAPQDKPYGARAYSVTDPVGHAWDFWQHLRDEVDQPEGWREVQR